MSKNRITYEMKDTPIDVWTLDYMVLLQSGIEFPCSVNQFSVMLDTSLLMKDSSVLNDIIHRGNFNPLHTTFLKFSINKGTKRGTPIWFLHVFVIRENGSLIFNSLTEFHEFYCNITEQSEPYSFHENDIPEGYNKELIMTLRQQPLIRLKYTENYPDQISLVEGFVDVSSSLPTPE
jgi:hypothetical protein